jgi:hypothetical protein
MWTRAALTQPDVPQVGYPWVKVASFDTKISQQTDRRHHILLATSMQGPRSAGGPQ